MTKRETRALARKAFDRAIREGRLSKHPRTDTYAAHFMYMGTWGGMDQFKHVETRRYLAGDTRPIDIGQSQA